MAMNAMRVLRGLEKSLLGGVTRERQLLSGGVGLESRSKSTTLSNSLAVV